MATKCTSNVFEFSINYLLVALMMSLFSSLQESSLIVKGMKDDVSEYEAILKDQFEEITVTKRSRDFCRYVTNCTVSILTKSVFKVRARRM